MKPFKDFTDEELDEFKRLRNKYFYPWDCWDAGCNSVNEESYGNYDDDDYDEILVCDYDEDTVCPMLEEWKMREKENK